MHELNARSRDAGRVLLPFLFSEQARAGEAALQEFRGFCEGVLTRIVARGAPPAQEAAVWAQISRLRGQQVRASGRCGAGAAAGAWAAAAGTGAGREGDV
jgi:hypothetical protein